MKYKVIISEKAKRMMAEHIMYLAKVSKPAAQKLKKRFISEFRSLQEKPQRYPFVSEDYIPANKYHKLYVENWYLVFYQIKDDIVYIEMVVDCRQDYQWLIKK